MKIGLGILISSVLLSQQAVSSESLIVNSIDWCPQLCSTGDKEGYVMDTVKMIFKDSPYELAIKTYPWTRAIKSVEQGQAHALLSPAKNEAPNLVFPEQEIGIQRMCFFTKSESKWTYTGPDSLKGIKVGLANDTEIEGLSSYISSHQDQFDFIPYSDDYLNISFQKVKFNRLDTFLFTYNSTKYELDKRNLSSSFREAGCVTSSKIYMAFTPVKEKQSDVEKISKYFDEKMKFLKETGEIKTIMKKYGLEDWQIYM